MKGRLLSALLSKQVIISALVLIFTAAAVFGAPRPAKPQPVRIELNATTAPQEAFEAALLLVDSAGREEERRAEVAARSGAAARLTAALAALKDRSAELGVWPAELPVPRVFTVGDAPALTAVVDLSNEVNVSVSVELELALLRSITGTLQLNGAADVRFLMNGEPTSTLLAHVAVPSGL